jgi:Nif-specific regulatory protein
MVETREAGNQRELDAVYGVSKILISSLDVARTFRESINFLANVCDWERAFVVVEEEGMLNGLCYVGLSDIESGRLHFEPGEGIVGRVFKSGMPAVVPDVSNEPLFLNRSGSGKENLAMLAMPIRVETRNLGVLVAFHESGQSRRFVDDLHLMRVIVTLMGQALLLHRSVSAAHDRMQDQLRRIQKAAHPPRHKLDEVIGNSTSMQNVFAQVHRVASSRTTVLLRGESGTGKEVIANAIHKLSPRNGKPFISVNCAALTETLLESELFGHEKGSFTGAQGQRKGRFELANGGTLFLDEIGDISPLFQAKLLRVLQEREFERVGGNATVKVDVRLILATNRDLERMVLAGEFRADLYYRINVVSIQLPPLRDRREDVPAIAEHFLDRFNRENGRTLQFTEDAMGVLMSCYWPGNVRELENCVERTATMTTAERIDQLAFPCQADQCLTRVLHTLERGGEPRSLRPVNIPIRSEAPEAPPAAPEIPDASLASEAPSAGDDADIDVIDDEGKPETERERLLWALERCGWVQAKAARLLKITPRQIGYALRKHNIEVRRF